MIGTKLGPYEIVNEIGSGGMGEVYRARDPRIGRDVAIKLISSNVVTTKEKLHRFEQEARATGALNHPNILGVYDVGTNDGLPYVVTELLEGETLRKRISAGPIPVRKVIDYAIQIANGLTAAHGKGIVHRDLKPENIFITKDGRVKILDFGLAKLTHPDVSAINSDEHETVSRITNEGMIVGTVAYMSPEQIRGNPVDHRSDIFAFGIILYEMLSGKRPFSGQSNIETMNAIIEKEAPEILNSNSEISPGFARIVHRCLEKEPERRFQSTHDLAFAFEALSGSRSGSVSIRDEKSHGINQKTVMIVLAAIILGALATYVLPKLKSKTSSVSEKAPFKLHQLTFGNGYVSNARFAPDGNSVFYSASWGGDPMEVYVMRIGDLDARSLGLKDVDLRAVSVKSEVAMDMNTTSNEHALASMPLSVGGLPRVLSSGGQFADWSPDDKNLAAIRWGHIEFPLGKTLYEPAGKMENLRFSPDGKYLAFFEANQPYGSIVILDQNGKTKKLGPPMYWNYVCGLAWSPSGKEIWFGKPSGNSNTFVISSVDMSGKVREILPMTGWFLIQDIFKDGRILIVQGYLRSGLMWGSTKDLKEKNISFLDGSELWDITNDGKTVLIQQNTSAVIASVPTIYLRRIDEPNAVLLGEAHPVGFSPDDQWVLAYSTKSGPKNSILLYPVTMGPPKVITPDLQDAMPILWFPDGKRILFQATIKGGNKYRDQDRSLFAFNIETKKSEQITPGGYYTPESVNSMSPDGKYLVAASINQDDRWYLYSLEEKKFKDLPGVDPGDSEFQWSSDGSYIYYALYGQVPRKVYRVHIPTGKKELLKSIMPSDPAGVKKIYCSITPDGNYYAYSYWRDLRQLVVIDGLK